MIFPTGKGAHYFYSLMKYVCNFPWNTLWKTIVSFNYSQQLPIMKCCMRSPTNHECLTSKSHLDIPIQTVAGKGVKTKLKSQKFTPAKPHKPWNMCTMIYKCKITWWSHEKVIITSSRQQFFFAEQLYSIYSMNVNKLNIITILIGKIYQLIATAINNTFF